MVGYSWIARALQAVAALALVATLGACSDYEGALPKHMRPLDKKTRDLVERKGMDERSPILIRIFKEEAELEVWKLEKGTGRYAFLKNYEVCAWSGVLGPKIKEGDRQAPEGFYTIRPAQMNPDSSYYLAFNMGYPNDFDRSLGRTGSELMVHGACSSRGCYSMTDESIQEIYTLGRLAFTGGQREFQVQAYPFRMTPDNMAKHRNDPNMPFWMMLKEGYDHTELLGQPPKVDVCDHRYIFNSAPAAGGRFDPSDTCPAMSMPDSLRIALDAKERKDNEQMLQIAERLDRKEETNGASALMLAFAAPSSAERAMSAPMSVATAPVSLEPAMTSSVGVSAPAMPQPQAAPAAVASAAPVVAPAPQSVASLANASAAAVQAEPAAPRAAPQRPAAITSAAPAPAEKPVPQAIPTPIPLPETATVLPVPVLGAPSDPGSEATLEERMLAGSAPNDANVENSYATAAAEDEGITGMVLRLIRK